MKKTQEIIKVDLLYKENFLEKFNQDEVSNGLINYLIEEMMAKKNKNNVKIEINNKCKLEIDLKKMIRAGLDKEYKKSLRAHNFYDYQQAIFFILGLALLLLSNLVTKSTIIKQVLIIIAWVPIWEMVELELFEDTQGRRRRKIIKKILRSKIEIENGD